MPFKQRFGPASVILVVGFIVGVGLRLFIDDASERDLANYVRSGLHGSGIAFAGWLVQGSFAAKAHSSIGAALRRLPLLAEVLIRSLVMTVVIVIVGLSFTNRTLRGVTPTTLAHRTLVQDHVAMDRCHRADYVGDGGSCYRDGAADRRPHCSPVSCSEPISGRSGSS